MQYQVAIDTDLLPGSGQSWLGSPTDGKVDSSANWEFLVQSSYYGWVSQTSGFGNTTSVIGPNGDKLYTIKGPHPVWGPDSKNLEFSVPWSVLKMAGPPSDALRLSIAVFRIDPYSNIIQFRGPNTLNAVDVVSNNGLPGVVPDDNESALKTSVETADNVLNYHFDLWFGEDGEIRSPILIKKVLANSSPGGSGQWFVIKNVTKNDIPLSNFHLSQRAFRQSGFDLTGYVTFPEIAVLKAGQEYTIAQSADDYFAFYGKYPDAALQHCSAGVPVMSPDFKWSHSPLALASGGDLLILSNPDYTLLDTVWYGPTTVVEAPGMTSFTSLPGPDQVLARVNPEQDTNNMNADFALVGTQCGKDSDCKNPCMACVNNLCAARSKGSDCSDGNVCNGNEVCDDNAVCLPGVSLNCPEDSNPCTTDLCDPTNGCVHPNSAQGTPCQDNSVCNGSESCDGQGSCKSSNALSCDDSNPCSVDACDAKDGCKHTPAEVGSPCATSTCSGQCSTLSECICLPEQDAATDAPAGDSSPDAEHDSGFDVAHDVASDASLDADSSSSPCDVPAAASDSSCGCKTGSSPSGLPSAAIVLAFTGFGLRRRRKRHVSGLDLKPTSLPARQ